MSNVWNGIAEAAFVTFFFLMVIYRVQIWGFVADADYRIWQHKAATSQFHVVSQSPVNNAQ